jgi:hypothetical protein
MPRPAPLLAAVALLVALAVPATASAGLFAGDPIDGPSPDVVAVGDVDLARDGTGALAYVKREGGVPHVFVARFVEGVFQPPERVDAGLPGAASAPAVAAAGGGRLAVAFVSGGIVHATVRPAGGGFAPPVALAPGERPAADMSVHGTGYVVFTSAGDVRAARLDRRTDAWTTIGAPLDVNPAAAAGTGARAPRVGVSADGVALVAWGEDGADGRSHVFARKVFGPTPSSRPQDLTLAAPAGGADAPDVDVEDDSSFAWVVFRQAVGGRLRALARRQRGTEFDPPVVLDAPLSGEGAGPPRIDLSGRGEGLATLAGETSHVPLAATLRFDAFAPALALSHGGPVTPAPVPALGDNAEGVVTWTQAPAGGVPGVQARPFLRGAPRAEAGLARPQLGPVDPALGFDAAADRLGSTVIAWVQGSAADRRVVVGLADRPPGFVQPAAVRRIQRTRRPLLRWAPAVELWGPVTYRLEVDGRRVAQTPATRAAPEVDLADGVHRWRVVAVDRRGQERPSEARLLRIDATPPRLRVRVARRGGVVRVRFRAVDRPRRGGSGLRSVRASLGRVARATRRSRGTLVLPTAARGRVVITARDRAGNRVVARR